MGFNEGTKACLQKIYSSPHFLIFQVRVPKNTIYLYLGRGNSFQCLGFFSKNIPSSQRVQDKFLQFARKNWKGAIIESIEMDPCDRIVHFIGRKGQYQIRISFFWRGRDLFFVHLIDRSGKLDIFRSWLGREVTNGTLLLTAEELFIDLNLELRKGSANAFPEDWWNSYIESDSKIEVFNKRKQKSLLRKKEKIIRDLEKVGSWSKLRHFAETAEDEEFQNITEVLGFCFKFRESESVYARRGVLHSKAKSLKKAESLLAQRLKDTEIELDAMVEAGVAPRRKLERIISPIWASGKRKKVSSRELPRGVKFFCYEGIKGALGTSAQGNDWVRIHFAKRDDYWFHLESGSSAHVVLKTDKINMRNTEFLELVASCIRDYSSKNYLDVAIIFTQVKNLRGVKGSPGKVLYKKERHLVLRYRNDWRYKLSLD